MMTVWRTQAEANDIFPTVADLAGLPSPPLCATPSSQEMYLLRASTPAIILDWDLPDDPIVQREWND